MGIPLDRFSVFILENASLHDALQFASRLGIKEKSIIIFEQLKIDDVRKIKNESEVLRNESIAFVIGDPTFEAQNALLKLTEEPPKDTYFIFYKPEVLLETIYSRAQVVRFKKDFNIEERLVSMLSKEDKAELFRFLFSLESKVDILNLLKYLINHYASRKDQKRASEIMELYKVAVEYNVNEKLLLINTFAVIEGE